MSDGKTETEVTDERTPEEIRESIEETREELGETVEELAAKTDVKARAQGKVEDVKMQAQETVGDVKAQASTRAQHAIEIVKKNPAPAIGGAVVALVVVRRIAKR